MIKTIIKKDLYANFRDSKIQALAVTVVLLTLIVSLLLSFFYLFFWIVLSVCISASAKKSAVALTYLIIIWVAAVFIIPSSGRIFLENRGKSLPSPQEIQAGYKQIESDMFEEAGRNNAGWRGGNLRANERDGHLAEKTLAPIYLSYIDVLDNYQYDVASQRIGQLDYLYNYSSVSPTFLFRRITEAFDNRTQQSFLDDVRMFRNNMMQTLMELDKRDEDSFHLFFLPNYMSQKPVNKDLIPRFSETERSYSGIIQQNFIWMILFLSEILFLFLVCQLMFNRYDIR